MAEKIKVLCFWASPFSKRVELALKLKGVEYEYIEEDLSSKSNLILESNPVHKKIPVLIHEGKPIAESQVILEYIDETWKHNPLLPEDPFERAKARFWAKFIDEIYLSRPIEDEEERKRATEELQRQLKILENELKGKDFFGGDKIGFLDVVANVIAFWVPLAEEVRGSRLLTEEKYPIIFGSRLLTEEKYPLIFKWIQKLVGIPVVLECKPPRDKHIAYFEDRIARREASKASSK